MRAWDRQSRLFAAALGCVVSISLSACAVTADLDAGSPGVAPAMPGSRPLQLSWRVNVAAHQDVFSRIDQWNAMLQIAPLVPSGFVAWRYLSSPAPDGRIRPAAVTDVRVADNPTSLGLNYIGPDDLDGPAATPDDYCHLVDSQKLRIPAANFLFLGACAADPQGSSKLVLFGREGPSQPVLTASGQIIKVSTIFEPHGGNGVVGIMVLKAENDMWLEFYKLDENALASLIPGGE